MPGLSSFSTSAWIIRTSSGERRLIFGSVSAKYSTALVYNSRPEGGYNPDIFSNRLPKRWAGVITSLLPLDSTVACSPASQDALEIWCAATKGYMDTVVRDGVGRI